MKQKVKLLGSNKNIFNVLNPFKLARNALWRYRATDSKQPHVFVLGCPRSGTTLTFSVLANHPAFASIKMETFFFVPRDIFNLENYRRMTNYGGLEIEETREILKHSNNLINFYDNYASELINKNNSKRFLEKTPIHVIYLPYLKKHYPKASFINVIRDGRDCFTSHLRLETHHHLPVDSFAKMWQNCINTRKKFGDDSQILDVVYEKLTENPKVEVKRIMDFLKEDFIDEQFEPKFFSNNKMFEGEKGHERLNSKIKPKSVGQWKISMSNSDKNTFNSIAMNELAQFGYNLT